MGQGNAGLALSLPCPRNVAKIPSLKPALLWPQGSLPVPWVVKAQKQQKDPQDPISGRKSSRKISAEPLSSPGLQIPQFGIPGSHSSLNLDNNPCSCAGNGAALGTDPALFLCLGFFQGLFPRALQVPDSRGSPALTLPNWEQLGAAQSLLFPILPGWETGFLSFLWSGRSFPSSASHPLALDPESCSQIRVLQHLGGPGLLWIFQGSLPGEQGAAVIQKSTPGMKGCREMRVPRIDLAQVCRNSPLDRARRGLGRGSRSWKARVSPR